MISKTKQHDIGVFGCDYDCLRTSFSSLQCIQKQTSVCFFLCGLQLRHFHPFICCHLGTGFFAGHIQCFVLQHISVSLYCPLANQELYEARLVEGTAQEFSALLYVVSSYQAFVLNGCACTSVYSFRICDGRWWYTPKTTSTLPLCPPTYSAMDKTDCQLCKCFVVAVHPFVPNISHQ